MEAIGPQRVDHHEDDVRVAALRERADVGGGAARPRRKPHLDLHDEHHDQQQPGQAEVGPGRIDQALQQDWFRPPGSAAKGAAG